MATAAYTPATPTIAKKTGLCDVQGPALLVSTAEPAQAGVQRPESENPGAEGEKHKCYPLPKACLYHETDVYSDMVESNQHAYNSTHFFERFLGNPPKPSQARSQWPKSRCYPIASCSPLLEKCACVKKVSRLAGCEYFSRLPALQCPAYELPQGVPPMFRVNMGTMCIYLCVVTGQQIADEISKLICADDTSGEQRRNLDQRASWKALFGVSCGAFGNVLDKVFVLQRCSHTGFVNCSALLAACGVDTEVGREQMLCSEVNSVKVSNVYNDGFVPLNGVWLSLHRTRYHASMCALLGLLNVFLHDDLDQIFWPLQDVRMKIGQDGVILGLDSNIQPSMLFGMTTEEAYQLVLTDTMVAAHYLAQLEIMVRLSSCPKTTRAIAKVHPLALFLPFPGSAVLLSSKPRHKWSKVEFFYMCLLCGCRLISMKVENPFEYSVCNRCISTMAADSRSKVDDQTANEIMHCALREAESVACLDPVLVCHNTLPSNNVITSYGLSNEVSNNNSNSPVQYGGNDQKMMPQATEKASLTNSACEHSQSNSSSSRFSTHEANAVPDTSTSASDVSVGASMGHSSTRRSRKSHRRDILLLDSQPQIATAAAVAAAAGRGDACHPAIAQRMPMRALMLPALQPSVVDTETTGPKTNTVNINAANTQWSPERANRWQSLPDQIDCSGKAGRKKKRSKKSLCSNNAQRKSEEKNTKENHRRRRRRSDAGKSKRSRNSERKRPVCEGCQEVLSKRSRFKLLCKNASSSSRCKRCSSHKRKSDHDKTSKRAIAIERDDSRARNSYSVEYLGFGDHSDFEDSGSDTPTEEQTVTEDEDKESIGPWFEDGNPCVTSYSAQREIPWNVPNDKKTPNTKSQGNSTDARNLQGTPDMRLRSNRAYNTPIAEHGVSPCQKEICSAGRKRKRSPCTDISLENAILSGDIEYATSTVVELELDSDVEIDVGCAEGVDLDIGIYVDYSWSERSPGSGELGVREALLSESAAANHALRDVLSQLVAEGAKECNGEARVTQAKKLAQNIISDDDFPTEQEPDCTTIDSDIEIDVIAGSSSPALIL